MELPGAVADMRGEWAKASICALTSRAEGFPLVVQEAMAAGVPVASYDCASGPREIIQHEVNGLLVSPESIAGMASALLRLATDDDLRHALGEGAFRTSRQYDAYAIAERWVGIFSAARTRRTIAGRLTPRVTALVDAKPVPTAAAEAVAATGVTPAQAREETLGWAVAAATASSDHWLVIPAHESGSPVVVVPMADRDAFLKELGDPGAPAYLSLRDPDQYGWPERRGPIFRLGEDLRRGMTPRLFVEPWPVVDEQRQLVGQGCSVEVQFWERHPDGALVSPRPNRYTNRIPAGEELVPLEIDGVAVRTLPLMAAPTVNECRFPVDVVYTWVDGDDPEWDAAREARISGMEGTAQTREASGRARFISRDELRYSLRSVHLFAPWVRNIYVVTSGQVPAWLALDHPGVTVVPHAEIMPADALPTFNSHAIETSLHHIPGLAEHWLYFNDDFFLGRPLRPEALFSPAGLSSVFFAQSTDRALGPARLGAVAQGRVEQPPPAAARLRRGDDERARPRAVRRPHLGAARDRAAVRRRGRRDDAVAVPVRHRHLDAELVRPALRAADRDGVRRRGRHRVRQHRQPRPRLAALAAAAPRAGLLLPRRPPRPRLPPGSPRRAADHVPARVLPRRGAVGEGRGTSPSGGRSRPRPRRAAS